MDPCPIATAGILCPHTSDYLCNSPSPVSPSMNGCSSQKHNRVSTFTRFSSGITALPPLGSTPSACAMTTSFTTAFPFITPQVGPPRFRVLILKKLKWHLGDLEELGRAPKFAVPYGCHVYQVKAARRRRGTGKPFALMRH